jgi:hypothetical protein
VTDTVTGLIWLKNANCFLTKTYASANAAAKLLTAGQCGLTDGSSPGDWRLPTKDEWSAMIARAVALGCTFSGPGTAPSLTNDHGKGCLNAGTGTSFTGVASVNYWSSTSNEIDPFYAWNANLELGNFNNNDKFNALAVWPVRGGPR